MKFTVRLDSFYRDLMVRDTKVIEWAVGFYSQRKFPQGAEPYYGLDQKITISTSLEQGILAAEGRDSIGNMYSLGMFERWGFFVPKDGSSYIIDGTSITEIIAPEPEAGKKIPILLFGAVAAGVGLLLLAGHKK